jgi:hypothetical protein
MMQTALRTNGLKQQQSRRESQRIRSQLKDKQPSKQQSIPRGDKRLLTSRTRGRASPDLPHSSRTTVSRPRALTEHSQADDDLLTSRIQVTNSNEQRLSPDSQETQRLLYCSQARHLMSRHKPFFHLVVHSLFKTARTLIGTNH